MNRLTLILATLTLASCATSQPGLNLTARESGPAWPASGVQTRVQYLHTFSTPKDLNIEKGFLRKFIDLFAGSEYQGLSRPYAVAVYKQSIAVADPDASVVHLFDQSRNRYRQIEQAGKYQFKSPISVALGNNRLYIADSVLNLVFVLDDNLDLLNVIDDFKRPTGLALDREQQVLYVTDTLAHHIRVHNSEGDLLDTIGERGDSDNQFNFPSHLAFSGDLLVINDTMNFRIQSYDSRGNHRASFGRQGDASGYLTHSKGVAIDSDGHIYIADALANRIQIFNQKGEFLMEFGGTGDENGMFRMPSGLAVWDDKIYVADSYNQRIQIFQYLKAEK